MARRILILTPSRTCGPAGLQMRERSSLLFSVALCPPVPLEPLRLHLLSSGTPLLPPSPDMLAPPSVLSPPNSLLRPLLQWAMSSALMVSAVTHVRMTPKSTAVSLLMDKAHRNLEAGRGSDAWEGWADEVR